MKRSTGLASFAALATLAALLSACPPSNPEGDAQSDARDATSDRTDVVTPIDAIDVADGATPDADASPPSDADGSIAPDGDAAMPDSGVLTITHCPGESLPPPATGTCTVTVGNAARLYTGTVLRPGEVLRGGQVLVDATGIIQCVGCDCSTNAGATGATAIVCPRGVISPGLINAHDHLTYVESPPFAGTAERFEHRNDWREGSNGHRHIVTPGSATTDQMSWGELRFVMGGATSTNGSGGTSGFLRNLDRAAQEEGLGTPAVSYQTFPLGDSSGTEITSGCGYSSSRDTTADAMGARAYTPHIAEGIGAASHNEFLCTEMNPNDLLQPNSAYIHGVALLPPDIQRMSAVGTKLIWSPRSNVALYGDTARVTEYAREGVTIALGTDWLASGSMNVLREFACIDGLNQNYLHHFFTDEQIWLMATRNAAIALDVSNKIGTLAVGLVADIAIFNGATRADHRAVISATPSDVVLVTRGATTLYGDANIVSVLPGGTACDPLTVCTVDKLVCVSHEYAGHTLMSLTTANNGLYPLYACEPRSDEPTCIPSRNAMGTLPNPVVNGSTRYAGMSSPTDMDGDGIDDAMDDCPTVFDPIRPLDNMHQPDFDGDHVGDACDPCPVVAGTDACPPFTLGALDSDGDGVPDSTDNCPDVSNHDQLDTDHDLHGDACDACPTVPNMGAAVCPATMISIPTLRNPAAAGHPAMGSRVTTSGVVVAVLANTHSIFIQDATATTYGGVSVFLGTSPTTVPAIGDLVTATGQYATFRGLEQVDTTLMMGSYMRTGTAAVPAPLVVTAAAIATPATALPLQSMLVRVDGLHAATATSGTDFTTVEGPNMIVTSFVASTSTTTSPFPATVGQTYTSITGVVYTFGTDTAFSFKLGPRTMADIVTP